MRIAFISDIHSNSFYFTKLLEQIKAENVEKIYCLGDIVGYYDNPNTVIELCIEHNITVIKGNHEKYLLEELGYDPRNEYLYRTQIQKRLVKRYLEYLKDLPEFLDVKIAGKHFYLTHSLPYDCTTYAYDFAQLTDKIPKCDYYCYGHTHIPKVGYHFGIGIINPGSVGQPRDYTKCPSYVILELEIESVMIRKFSVDYVTYTEMLKKKGYGSKAIKFLQRKDRTNSK